MTPLLVDAYREVLSIIIIMMMKSQGHCMPRNQTETRELPFRLIFYAKLIITICILAFSLVLIKYQGTEPGLGKASRSVKRKCPL